ncbi:hypothetical protein NDU88_004624 [Pleurodeles waltl]|uniref:Uncharacterized protein n=1 Tax=Pleurodeles waltl TaxID=8319 RepID=A0AAV7W916_PLEWA|nr:hypothetical protein NDU88_004624 [Pleurodeles waltl]
MSPGKAAGKSSGKSTRQLLFSEAVLQTRPMSSAPLTVDHSPTVTPENPYPDTAMERILQELSAVGCRLEAMNSKITDFKSIRADIAGFQDKVTDLDHRLHTVENKVAALPDHEQELQYLHNKLTDLADQSRRDNVRFFGLREKTEGADISFFSRTSFLSL